MAITVCGLSVVAILLGAGFGLYLHSFTAPKTSQSVVTHANNNEELFAKYSKVIAFDKSPDFSSLVQKNVFTYSDIANVSLMLLKTHTNYMTQGKGWAKGGPVTQQIRDTVIRDGDSYMEESISNSSVVSLASRAFQTTDGIKLYKGLPLNGNVEVGSYSATSTDFTLSSYLEAYGRTVDTPIIYLITDSTVNPSSELPESGDSPTSFTKTDQGYTLELELAPSGSTTNYAVQMTTISNLSSLYFAYVHLTMYLSPNLELLATQSHESYTVTLKAVPFPTRTEGRLRTEYKWDEVYKIPDLQSPIAYRNGD